MLEEPIILESDINIDEGYMDPGRLRTELFNLIYRGRDSIRLRFSVESLDRVINLYFERLPGVDVSELDRSGIYSYLVPVEDVESRIPPQLSEVKSVSDIEELSNLLSGYSLGSYDSSWHTAGAHFILTFVVYNTGYYYYCFGDGKGGSGSHPKIVIGLSDDWDNDLEIKRHELRVARSLGNKLYGRYKLMFLDESLNSMYAIKWSRSKREVFLNTVLDILSGLMERGVAPLGIFYTRARDLIRTLSASGADIDIVLTDKTIMNRLLDVGERSPVFKVYNKVIDDFGLDVSCFYLKISDRNILRVEFPTHILDYIDVDTIHIGVYIDALRGGGYPYSLIRAHEMAVLDYEDREGIEAVLADILGVPQDMLYSMKQYSKWRSLA